jgi:hypothetical protein
MKKQITTLIVLAALAVAWPAAAQDTPATEQQIQPPPADQAAASRPINMNDMRRHIYVMEGALAQAVDFGAKELNRQISSAMPGVFMLEGEATARGVHLDGYGVFFDVRVPMMRQSMVWSMRMIQEQNDAAMQANIEELRRSLQGVTDQNTRAAIQKAIANFERQSGNVQPRAQQQGNGAVVSPSAEAIPVGAAAAAGMSNTPRMVAGRADNLWVKDPSRAYTEAVTRALVDAMIDYSTPMAIPAEQWLTVAARDDEGRNSLAPQDPLEEVVTMIYRIKGSDLQLYRAGKIDRDEVRKRVQISQF